MKLWPFPKKDAGKPAETAEEMAETLLMGEPGSSEPASLDPTMQESWAFAPQDVPHTSATAILEAPAASGPAFYQEAPTPDLTLNDMSFISTQALETSNLLSESSSAEGFFEIQPQASTPEFSIPEVSVNVEAPAFETSPANDAFFEAIAQEVTPEVSDTPAVPESDFQVSRFEVGESAEAFNNPPAFDNFAEPEQTFNTLNNTLEPVNLDPVNIEPVNFETNPEPETMPETMIMGTMNPETMPETMTTLETMTTETIPQPEAIFDEQELFVPESPGFPSPEQPDAISDHQPEALFEEVHEEASIDAFYDEPSPASTEEAAIPVEMLFEEEDPVHAYEGEDALPALVLEESEPEPEYQQPEYLAQPKPVVEYAPEYQEPEFAEEGVQPLLLNDEVHFDAASEPSFDEPLFEPAPEPARLFPDEAMAFQPSPHELVASANSPESPIRVYQQINQYDPEQYKFQNKVMLEEFLFATKSLNDLVSRYFAQAEEI